MADTPPRDFAFPFRLAPDGQLATVEQGSPPDVAQRALILGLSPYGWWDGRPDFGLQEQTFLEGGADVDEIERQLSTHIPDIELAVKEDLSALNDALDVLGVQIPAE